VAQVGTPSDSLFHGDSKLMDDGDDAGAAVGGGNGGSGDAGGLARYGSAAFFATPLLDDEAGDGVPSPRDALYPDAAGSTVAADGPAATDPLHHSDAVVAGNGLGPAVQVPVAVVTRGHDSDPAAPVLAAARVESESTRADEDVALAPVHVESAEKRAGEVVVTGKGPGRAEEEEGVSEGEEDSGAEDCGASEQAALPVMQVEAGAGDDSAPPAFEGSGGGGGSHGLAEAAPLVLSSEGGEGEGEGSKEDDAGPCDREHATATIPSHAKGSAQGGVGSSEQTSGKEQEEQEKEAAHGVFSTVSEVGGPEVGTAQPAATLPTTLAAPEGHVRDEEGHGSHPPQPQPRDEEGQHVESHVAAPPTASHGHEPSAEPPLVVAGTGGASEERGATASGLVVGDGVADGFVQAVSDSKEAESTNGEPIDGVHHGQRSEPRELAGEGGKESEVGVDVEEREREKQKEGPGSEPPAQHPHGHHGASHTPEVEVPASHSAAFSTGSGAGGEDFDFKKVGVCVLFLHAYRCIPACLQLHSCMLTAALLHAYRCIFSLYVSFHKLYKSTGYP
jgi:hypothetical protein